MNPLEKLFGSLMNKQKNDAVVGLDIGSSFAKVVQIRKKAGKVVLDSYGEVALGPVLGLEVGQSAQVPVEKLVAVIADLFKEAKITGKDMVLSLPYSSSLLTVIDLPDVGEEKLKEVIPIEARKYIPTAAADVSLNWWVIPKSSHPTISADAQSAPGNGPRVQVLLAAVHNDVIERYKQIAQKIGATNVSFEIEIFSTMRIALGRESALTMIVDIGASSTKVVIVEDGVVRSSHLVGGGSQDVTVALSKAHNIALIDAEEVKREFGLLGDPDDPTTSEIMRLAVAPVLSEINRIYMKYDRDKHVPVGKIVLSGGGALLKGLPAVVQTFFPETKIELAHAFTKVEAPEKLVALLAESGPEFAVALGLALRKM